MLHNLIDKRETETWRDSQQPKEKKRRARESMIKRENTLTQWQWQRQRQWQNQQNQKQSGERNDAGTGTRRWMDGKKKVIRAAMFKGITETAAQNEAKNQALDTRFQNAQRANCENEKKKRIKFINSQHNLCWHRRTHQRIFMAHKQIGIPIEMEHRVAFMGYKYDTHSFMLLPLTLPSQAHYLAIQLHSLARSLSSLHNLHCDGGDL